MCAATRAQGPADDAHNLGQGDSHEPEEGPQGHLRARHRRRGLHRQPHRGRASAGRLPGRRGGRPLQRKREGHRPHRHHRRRGGGTEPHVLQGGRERPRGHGGHLRPERHRPRHPLRRLQGRGRVRQQAHRVLHQQPGQHPHARGRDAQPRLQGHHLQQLRHGLRRARQPAPHGGVAQEARDQPVWLDQVDDRADPDRP